MYSNYFLFDRFNLIEPFRFLLPKYPNSDLLLVIFMFHAKSIFLLNKNNTKLIIIH